MTDGKQEERQSVDMPALYEQVSCELPESIRIRVPENSAWKLDVSRCEVLPVLRGEGERMSKITMDTVRDLIERHSDHISGNTREFYNGAYAGIADELNSRAERTCKQEERGWGTEGDHARVWLTCGHDCMVPTVQDLPNYCPNCGAKVIGG